MRLCDLTTLYIDGGEGGVNTYLREKAEHLGDAGIEHTMIVPSARDEVRRVAGSTLYGIASPRYFRNPQHRVLLNHRAVTEILRRVAPNVVECDCASPLPRVAARALPRETTLLAGFYHVHLPRFFARAWARPLGGVVANVAEEVTWRYILHCMKPCDHVLVSSSQLVEELAARGVDDIEHLPLGVNLELFRPARAVNGGAVNGHARADVQTILHVGRLSAEKDIPLLLKAFDQLSARRRARLRIVGDGPLRSRVEAFARGRDDVEYLGLRHYGKELAEIYRSADVFALPSPSETFGLTVLEALASDVPVVAVQSGGPSQLVSDELGALARPGDARDFAAKLERTLDAVRDGARGRRREHIVRNFSWEETFKRLLAFYRDALEAKRLRATSPPRALLVSS